MELIGSTLVFVIGLVIFVFFALEIVERIQWGYSSKKDPLVIYVPFLLLGGYLMYLPFS